MVAGNSQHPTRARRNPTDCITASELASRLEEEVSRAARHHSSLSCLLVRIDDIGELARAHGEPPAERALAYLGAALARQLRRYDRIGRSAADELLVVLPGADERRGEIVARRALGRLHAIKIDLGGERHPLRLSVGIAAWRDGLTAEQLLQQTRAAARTGRDEQSDPAPVLDWAQAAPAARATPSAGERRAPTLRPS